MTRRWVSFREWLTNQAPEPQGWRQTGLFFVAITALTVVFTVYGMWYAAWFGGLVVGRSFGPARRAIPAGALAGLLTWALPLVWDEWRYGLGPSAQSLAAIMGFPHRWYVPLILTCLVGLLLGLTGAWAGSAARSSLSRAAGEG